MIPDLTIIEGVTGSGKSTVAGRLATEFGRPVYHHGAPGTEDPRELLQFFLANLVVPYPKVFDRWTASNLVYARVLGNQKSLTRTQFESLELEALRLYSVSVGVVTLVADPPLLQQRITERRHKHTPKPITDNLDRLSLGYAKVRYGRLPNKHVRVYASDTQDAVYRRVLHALEEMRHGPSHQED